jgi:hypothetical protein
MFPGRGVSLKGQFYSYIVDGRLVVAKWPRRQPTARTAKEAENRKLLAKAARFTPYMSAGSQAFAAELAKVSKLLPRDFLMIALFNRIGYVVFRDGRKVFSMAAVTDVSNLLDALGQVPGDILVRGDTWWERLPVGAPGQVLTVQPDSKLAWEDASSGGGGSAYWKAPFTLKPRTAAGTINPGNFIGIPIMTGPADTISGIKIWCAQAGTGKSIVGGLYASNGFQIDGGALLAQSAAIPTTYGVLAMPFAAPVPLAADTFYWIGIAINGGSGDFKSVTAEVIQNNYQYWGQGAGSLPSIAPPATDGGGGSQFTWWAY